MVSILIPIFLSISPISEINAFCTKIPTGAIKYNCIKEMFSCWPYSYSHVLFTIGYKMPLLLSIKKLRMLLQLHFSVYTHLKRLSILGFYLHKVFAII